MRKLITLSAGLLLGCAPAGPPVTHAGPPEDRPHLVLQVGPRDSVTAVAFSPDGQLVASGSFDGKVRVYDRRTGALLRAIGTEPCRGLNAIAFAPDGKTLASGGSDRARTRGSDPSRAGGVRPWDVATEEVARGLPERGRIHSLAFAPDGKSLACAVGRGVRLYEVKTGRPALPMARSRSGTWRRERYGRSSRSGPLLWAGQSPSRSTARRWRARPTTGRCGCGTWPPARSECGCMPTLGSLAGPRSRRTANAWRPPARTARPSSGGWPLGRPSPLWRGRW